LAVRETADVGYRGAMKTDTVARDLESGKLHDILAETAEAAARLILPYWRNDVEVMSKADDSPVTLADQQAEALILDLLAKAWPQVPAVAEEAVATDGAPAVAPARYWLIDPLDGTRGFVQGKEAFTVNIALVENGRLLAGVVSAPALGVTWRTGLKGAERRAFGEAWRAIKVRERPNVGVALLSHSITDEEAERLMRQNGCGVWQGMDSSLKFCLIAEGRFDAYPRTGPTHEWDTAAGQAVLEAAGGRVLGGDGQPLAYGKPAFLNGPFNALGG
jgi:3'(2'), 5'-bisphosphate nucleotidase